MQSPDRLEAAALLHYVLSGYRGWTVTDAMIDRYVHALASRGNPTDRRKKLLIAAAIAECSPESAQFLLPRERSVFSILLKGIWIGLRGLPSFFRKRDA